MKNKFFEKILKGLMPALLFCLCSFVAVAQIDRDDYSIHGNVVSYRGIPLDNADPQTFVVLGHGYAKDYYNVYLEGMILKYVDPSSFRLKAVPYPEDGRIEFYPEISDWQVYPETYGRQNYGYVVTSNTVLFNGRKIEGASSYSFEILQGGYAKDTFNVYFLGRKIDASGSSFKYLGDGYAKDAFNAYYYGSKMDGIMVSTFKVLGGGYAEDSFDTYYRGRKVK